MLLLINLQTVFVQSYFGGNGIRILKYLVYKSRRLIQNSSSFVWRKNIDQKVTDAILTVFIRGASLILDAKTLKDC